MRKVEQKVISAFLADRAMTIKNTASFDGKLYLHGNLIAYKERGSALDGEKIYATLAGWNTLTTRSRLNALCQMIGIDRPFYQKDHEPFFMTRRIDARDHICLTHPF